MTACCCGMERGCKRPLFWQVQPHFVLDALVRELTVHALKMCGEAVMPTANRVGFPKLHTRVHASAIWSIIAQSVQHYSLLGAAGEADPEIRIYRLRLTAQALVPDFLSLDFVEDRVAANLSQRVLVGEGRGTSRSSNVSALVFDRPCSASRSSQLCHLQYRSRAPTAESLCRLRTAV